MKSTDSDLTLRALDRLPPEEVREFESRLADDPALAADLRDTEDALVAIWQSASPLRPAPAGSFAAIQSKLHPVRSRPALPIALAAVGWAAALALLAVVLNRPETPMAVLKSVPPALGKSPEMAAVSPVKSTVVRTDAPLRETIRRLQENLAAARSGKSGPRIRELHAPGSASQRPSEDNGRALLDLLTAALSESLARRTETPAALTVETGWLESAFAALPAGSVIRHRSFPVENFADFGLLRSANGDYYDPAANLLWSPSADGGGYLGRAAATDLDRSLFESGTPEYRSTPQPLSPAVKPSPSGYLVQGGTDDETTVIIGNLPTDGTTQQLVASIDGGLTTIPLTQSGLWPGVNGTGFATYSISNSFEGGQSMQTLSSGFSILQSNANGTFTLILSGSP